MVLQFLKERYVWFGFIILYLGAAAFFPQLWGTYNLATILLASAPLVMITLGENFVILTGNFDLSIGATASLTTAVLSVTMAHNILMALFLAIIVGFVIGAVNGIFISKLNIDSFILTLGMMFVVSGIALMVRPSPGGTISQSIQSVVNYQLGSIPITPFLSLLFFPILGGVILQYRDFGRKIYAVGGDENAALLIGTRIERVKIMAFIISGVFAAISGIYLAAWTGTGSPTVGNPYLFSAITAIILGGTLVTGGEGRYIDTVGACLLIVLLRRVIFFAGLASAYIFVFEAIIIVIIVLIRNWFGGEI